ncbi:MAG: amidase [Spirulinaceae cyanobacterium]
MDALTFLPAHQLAQLIRDRTLSVVEVVESHLAQIEQHNPQLNAVCTLAAEQARHQAQQADAALDQGELWGPLHGVPVTIKDIFATANLRTTAGYIPLRDYLPTTDAAAVARLRAAGAIILGKTNLAELAGDFQSTNSLFPRVNNPWDLSRTAGGSSGGSAAAVAAGFAALDLGNDIAGSVRQPAHFCGVYALKPTEGRISNRGMIPEVPGMPHCLRQMLVTGCFARSVADLQLVLTVLAGSDRQRPDVPPVPFVPQAPPVLKSLNLAWLDQWPDVPTHSEIQAALQSTVQTLQAQGATVTRWQPPDFDLGEVLDIYTRLAIAINFYAQPINRHTLRRSLTQIWRTATQGDRHLRQLCNFGRHWPQLLNPSLKGYFEVWTERDRLIAQLEAALEPWDAWLLPVAATPAFAHCPAWSAVEVAGMDYPHALVNGAYTMPFSLTGQPVVVLPIGQTTTGLPIGLQLVGQRWDEARLLAIAQALEPVLGDWQAPPRYVGAE